MDLRECRVLVTGADGFIGSHLVERLVSRGCRVRAFVFYNALNSWGWLDGVSRDVLDATEVISGDIRDPHGVAAAVEGCEVIFHLAALIGIPFSYHSPDSYVDTNVRGTLNVLQAARAAVVRAVLITSTSEVYGTAQYVPIDEKHPLQAQSPYSATKIGADRLAEAFHRSFGVPVTIVRPFNTFGPRQSARAVIPTVITQLLEGRSEIRLGSLAPTRDFNYVADTVDGFIAIAESDAAVGEEINIASGRECGIGTLARLLIDRISPGASIASDDERVRPPASEVERLVGDNRKLLALTAWRPAYDLEKGLDETVRWFRDPANLARYKSWQYNV